MELTMKGEERLLNIIASGLAQFQQSSTLQQLGDRASYIGMSDVASLKTALLRLLMVWNCHIFVSLKSQPNTKE